MQSSHLNLKYTASNLLLDKLSFLSISLGIIAIVNVMLVLLINLYVTFQFHSVGETTTASLGISMPLNSTLVLARISTQTDF